MSIRVESLTKSFGSLRAVDNLSFEVESGSVFAFLGTNGAGKTTTISCLTTLLQADSGEIELNGLTVGKDDRQIRSQIGVVFQDSILDPLLTVGENLKTKAAFYEVEGAEKRIAYLAELIDIGEFIHRRYGLLSGGQKRRADIARALLHSPALLFLDEPTAGLDPQSRENVWNTVHQLRTELGLTLFLTTHYMEETENANRVLVIDHGRAIAEGSPAELRSKYSSTSLTVIAKQPADVSAAAKAMGLECELNDAGVAKINAKDSLQALELLKSLGSAVEDFELRHGNMDDVFLNLTARGGK